MDRIPVLFWVSGLSDLAYVPTIHVKWVATHPWAVVLHLTTSTIMGMAWCFCSSHQILSHSLGALMLGWTWSKCIDWVPCTSDLAHVHIRWYGMGYNISMDFGSSCNSIHQPEDDIFIILVKSSPTTTTLVLWGLNGHDTSVWIVSQTCQTLPIYTQGGME